MTDDAAEPRRPEGAGSAEPPQSGDSFEAPGTAFTSRYGLVRPRQGRYLAGVCAAIGRATNTDPVLWRVLLAVLGFFGGIGILIYLGAWLIIPAEGDTASPVESMLGRGRSSMSPLTVIILGVLVAVLFGLIVTDGFRAVVLGAAALIGGALLLNRKPGRPAPVAPAGGEVPFGAGRPWQAAAQPYPPMPGPGPGPTPPTVEFPAAPPGPPPPTPPMPPVPPTSGAPGSPPPYRPGLPYPPAPPAPPTPPGGGYRPPFAPHGPYAGPGPGPYPPRYGPPPAPPKPPKPPKERSPLGAATFSLIFVALGLVAALDLGNLISVAPSTYFFAVLVTLALGLLIGAWFGRARWLIALGFIAAAALGISTIAETQVGRYETSGSDVYWQPASAAAMADRYEHNFGNAILDLSKVDFAGQDQLVNVHVSFGNLEVIMPPNVDTTVQAEVNAGDAQIFDTESSGFQASPGDIVDNGADGVGGGKVTIVLKVNAGSAEVHRA